MPPDAAGLTLHQSRALSVSGPGDCFANDLINFEHVITIDGLTWDTVGSRPVSQIRNIGRIGNISRLSYRVVLDNIDNRQFPG